jgi:hypothetical protein
VQTLGATGARALLTRFGYAHGWRTAETLRNAFPWDSEEEWKTAGGRLHTLQGLVRSEPIANDPTATNGPGPAPIGHSVWQDSYEAEQHLLHLGRAEEPVCWTLTGFASGYLSPEWTPDGHYIVVSRAAPLQGLEKLWLYHIDGGTGLPLVRLPGGLRMMGPAFGPSEHTCTRPAVRVVAVQRRSAPVPARRVRP